jgi:hypothetical protein
MKISLNGELPFKDSALYAMLGMRAMHLIWFCFAKEEIMFFDCISCHNAQMNITVEMGKN